MATRWLTWGQRKVILEHRLPQSKQRFHFFIYLVQPYSKIKLINTKITVIQVIAFNFGRPPF